MLQEGKGGGGRKKGANDDIVRLPTHWLRRIELRRRTLPQFTP